MAPKPKPFFLRLRHPLFETIPQMDEKNELSQIGKFYYQSFFVVLNCKLISVLLGDDRLCKTVKMNPCKIFQMLEKVEDVEEFLFEAEEVKVERLKMEGMASIALLLNGSISGHFVHLPHSVCYGIHGTELVCERECSRGEDYRLVKLTIIDFNSKKERDVVVERRGHDAARLCNVDHAHGWEKDVVNLVDQKHRKSRVVISFECEKLKADEAAEDHIKRFMPKLTGMDAVVNIGKMSITGLDFKAEVESSEQSS